MEENKFENEEKIKIEKSKHGIPCLWESGGAWTNTGSSTIICDSKGGPKTPLYIKRRGDLACLSHALIPLNEGDYVITVDQHRGDVEIQVQQITGLEGEEATVKTVAVFSDGEWDNPLPEKLSTAVETAVDKSKDYHCRSPYYIKSRGEKNE